MTLRVGILISGRGSNMEALIRAAAEPGYPASIAIVIANRQDAAGIGIAIGLGIPAAYLASRDFPSGREAHERALDTQLRASSCDVVCLAGYMRLLSPWFVARWAGRLLNIHPSLLPRHPGLDTHARAIAAGDATHGCTVHLVTDGMDEGPILAQASVPILPGDTEPELAARVLEQEHRLYPAALAEYARTFGLPEPPAQP